MTNSFLARVRTLSLVVASAGSLAACGCAESGNFGMAAQRAGENRAGGSQKVPAERDPAIAPVETDAVPAETVSEGSSDPNSTSKEEALAVLPTSGDASPTAAAPADASLKPSDPVPANREFVVEGPDKALRVGYDDLDLLKLLKMDPVTPDCIEKMPSWLRALDGKTVRIRGFMKPGLLMEGIPQFTFVRDTGLCCFGPAGKIYDLIAVTLKEGTTTSYIELKPFDVVGKFRIELLQLEGDDEIFGLYYIDDARIIQKK